MYVIVDGTLNHITFESIIKEIITSKEKTVTVDLTATKFIEPYGMTGLVTAARYCKQHEINFKIILPSLVICSYMQRMNVFASMSEYEVLSPPKFPKLLPSLKSKQSPLLEVIKIKSGEDYNEIAKITNILSKRMKLMMGGDNDKLTQSYNSRLITNIVEVCQNAKHSEDIAYVAAQKYETRHGRVIKVGYMDLGLGMLTPLKRRYEEEGKRSRWNDLKSIRLALQPNVSSRPEGGGIGLTQLKDFITKNEDSELIIRSGAAKLKITSSGDYSYRGLSFFPGTQISITIRI